MNYGVVAHELLVWTNPRGEEEVNFTPGYNPWIPPKVRPLAEELCRQVFLQTMRQRHEQRGVAAPHDWKTLLAEKLIVLDEFLTSLSKLHGQQQNLVTSAPLTVDGEGSLVFRILLCPAVQVTDRIEPTAGARIDAESAYLSFEVQVSRKLVAGKGM